MPLDENGDSLEIMLNPIGVGARMNAGQVLESLGGKIAKKTGKTLKIAEVPIVFSVRKFGTDGDITPGADESGSVLRKSFRCLIRRPALGNSAKIQLNIKRQAQASC